MFGVMSRYVAREFLSAFLVAFLFFFFVFVANVLLVTAEQIFANQVPIGVVGRLMLFSLPLIVFYSVPFGTLLGALMAVSRLSADNEVIAVMAAGIPLRRLFLPLAAAGVILSGLSFVFNDLLLPASNIEFSRTYRRMLATNPSVELEPFAVERYEGMAIVTGAIDGGTIETPLILDRTAAGERRLIIARSASFAESTAQDGVISLHLKDVLSHVADIDDTRHEYLRADSMEYNILLRDVSGALGAAGPTEMSSVDLRREIRSMQVRLETEGEQRADTRESERYRLLAEVAAAERTVAADPGRLPDERDRIAAITTGFERSLRRTASERTVHTYLLELHKKYAIPLACLAFMALALPAGLLARRAGRTFGFLVGICLCFLYWTLLTVGETTSLRAGFAPALPVWLPNAVVLVAAGAIAVLNRAR